MNIDNIIKKISDTVASHRMENDGEYTRWIWQNKENSRKLGLNEYGCADAVNILYTIGEFPNTSASRETHIRALQNLQNYETGLFTEATHHPIHTTAHCIAALELFDTKPLFPLKNLMQYATDSGVKGLLEGLDWTNNPWDMSHRGAGIYAAMVLSGSVDSQWEDTYFDWLWENADSNTGFWRKDAVLSGEKPVFHHLAGTFHYMFNHEYAHRPLRYPQKVIDTCISLYEEGKVVENFGSNITFAEIDWVYCISRASRQTPHRHEDCRRLLKKFAEGFIEFLNGIDEKTHDGFNDLHMLFGTVCCLAELQQALPGVIRTKKPLKLVLDRRPFI